jgi:hypothetical protein
MSIYFNGNGDHLSMADSDKWHLGTGDFTIEFWMNPTNVNADYILGQSNGGSNFGDSGDESWHVQYSSSHLGFRVYTTGAATPVSSYNFTTTFAQDTWYHIAIVRSGNTLYGFKNGVLISSTGISVTIPNSAKDLIIGTVGYTTYSTDYDFNGHLQEVRISDTARWTSNFTPQLSPYENDVNTKLLLHMVGDATSQHDISTNGDVELTKTKMNGAIYLDGNDWLSIPHSTKFNLGSSDFTLDTRVRFTALSTNQTFLSKHNETNTDYEFAFLYHSTNQKLQLNYSTNGTTVLNVVSSTTWVPTLNKWYHIAFVRTGNNIQFYIDGVKLGTDVAFSNTFFASVTAQKIGAGTSGGAYVGRFTGYIDELRFSDKARWTTGFTPETIPYTNTRQTPDTFNRAWSNFRLDLGTAWNDLQVDWDSNGAGATDNWNQTFAIWNGELTDKQFVVYRKYDTANGHYYRCNYNDGTGWVNGSIVSTTDTSGKFKITRSYNIMTAYYWDGDSWEQLVSATVPWDYNPSVILYCGSTGSNLDLLMDNFVINSGSVTWSTGTTIDIGTKDIRHLSNSILTIGAINGGSQSPNFYMDELRITKSARWTKDFTTISDSILINDDGDYLLIDDNDNKLLIGE